MSSMHWSLTAPNGMNFTKSVGNPKSRLERVRSYLWLYGSATKRQILADVFDRTIVEYSSVMKREVTRGWASYVFTYGIRQGFFQKHRIGNEVFYALGPAGLEQLTRRY